MFDDTTLKEIIALYESGVSQCEIGKIYGVGNSNIRYYLIKAGISLRGLKESVSKSIKTKEINETTELNENMIGWILGDGSIRLAKQAVNPFFNYTDKKKDHIDHVANILTLYNIKYSIFFNQKNECYQLQSECLPYFKKYYDLFYGYEGLNENNQKRKILPDVILTPTILLNWYIGDGSVKSFCDCKNNGGTISCKYKNDFVINQLKDMFGHVACHSYKSGNNYYFNHMAFCKMLKYIGPCPIDSYKYKWITRKCG